MAGRRGDAFLLFGVEDAGDGQDLRLRQDPEARFGLRLGEARHLLRVHVGGGAQPELHRP